MKRLSCTLGTLGLFVLSTTIVFAQQPQQAAPQGQGGRGGGRGAPFPPPTNLQVLPKDITIPELQDTMQAIAQGLGVQCTYCHVQPAAPPPPAGAAPAAAGRGGRGGAPPLDFASDDKAEKKTARVMLRMVNDLNTRIIAEVAPAMGRPVAEMTRVQCVTCHRGITAPRQISTILTDLMVSKGEGAALAKYRELRGQFYGAQAYDFSEPMLVRLAQQSLAANKPDDAIAWLKLNLEFYPKSSPSYVAMSQVHTRKMDNNSAIAALEKAVELDPDNAATKRQLDQLKGVAPAAPGAPAAPAQ
ncbi:MAG: hypothetical protein A3G76_05395 [Acidobacteria bacterium RIFCSPLOWO2_12_FULL_65_11]|nr:MAG: hypothetical protein A3G76_05395 [Acidobacteria bacterium RIFCSPLOWO2_12_FULL_65_11]